MILSQRERDVIVKALRYYKETARTPYYGTNYTIGLERYEDAEIADHLADQIQHIQVLDVGGS